MAEDRNDQAKQQMAGNNPGDQSQQAPGRGGNDDFSTENRGASPTPNKQNEFDREDREREQPGSKQRDQDRDQ